MDFDETRVTRYMLVAVLAIVSSAAVVQPAAADRRAIRVVVDNEYAPYSFRSNEGTLQGIVIDQWRAWEKKTGIKAEIQAMDWDQALRRMRAGDFDVIDNIIETDQRRADLDFTEPYATVEASIFFRSDISGITALASLRGFPVGVKAGDQHIDRLRENGVTAVVEFPNNAEIINAARQHKIDVFVIDVPSALYLLNKLHISSDFRRSAPIFRDRLRRGVHKGDGKTLTIVSNGFAAIDPGELKRINEEWFGRTIDWYRPYFIHAAYTAVAALLVIVGLIAWNRTLRKRVLLAIAAVKQAEDRVRLIIDTIPIMAWSVRTDGTVDFLNQRWLDYTGLSLEEYVKEPTGPIHPDETPIALDRWVANMATGEAYEMELRLRRADGEYRWFLVRTVPLLGEHGSVVKWYGTSTDIEDRKRAEEKLRRSEKKLAEAQRISHVGHWERNIEGGEIVCSEETYRIFGLPQQDSIRNLEELLHPEDRPLHAEAIVRAMHGEPFDLEYRVVRHDGEIRFVHSQGSAIQDQSGRPRRTFGAVQDVTEIKRTEERLKATSAQLRALSARLQSAREEEGSRIAREIHDELGATLTSLRWELEAIKKTLSEPGEALPAADLRAKLEVMFGLIDAMVDMVRGIASDLRPVVLDVLGLEEAIEWQAQQFQDRTGIVVVCHAPDDDVDVSPEQSIAVFRIFQEALTNILRHAYATRVDVTIAMEAEAYVLIVKDNGRGITEGEKYGQSSIGLLGMRERAHLLGGEIEITGIRGEGTTVTVRLPRSSRTSEAGIR
jgi:PAS domain S-box-containing protein